MFGELAGIYILCMAINDHERRRECELVANPKQIRADSLDDCQDTDTADFSNFSFYFWVYPSKGNLTLVAS